ncbi:MAG: 4-hydroxy-tetrahydrodipicolinate synthase [Burkholderiaceae bacterium]|jgi:4-hydroxy-tetrahydrodipicolinate synthase|nr:4-hydroxy-tetrahydrodipicolinate synthase [Burkholderiaceae bacterium]
MIQGSIVAVVTPMRADGSLDLACLRRLIDWHIQEGTDAIVIVGTTGESPTVSVEEHRSLVRTAVEQAAGRVPVIAGTGGNATSEAIALTRYAKEVGAVASLQVVPYYNRPTQEGMYRHFSEIAAAVDIPVILYNVPGRTVADISNDTVVRLASIPNIVGLKDATGNLSRGIDLLAQVPDGFAVYSGDDASALALMLCGGHGNISVVANVAPRMMHQLCASAIKGDIAVARTINDRLLPLHQKLFVEPNPVPVKWLMHRLGLIEPGIRLPLAPLDKSFHDTVWQAWQSSGNAAPKLAAA